MKQITCLLWTLCLSIFIITQTFSQISYNSSYHVGVGNPSGLNTLDDNKASADAGWRSILPTGSFTSNNWTGTVEIPFPFEFYGQSVTHLKASYNGVITFDTATTIIPANNTNLPTAGLPNLSIASYWAEFTNFSPLNGNIYIKTFGEAPNRQFWIWYDDFKIEQIKWTHFGVVLEERTNKVYSVDGTYTFTSGFPNPGGPTSGSIGVQQNATNGTQYGNSSIDFNNTSFSKNASDNNFYLFEPNYGTDAGIVNLASPTMPFGAGTYPVSVILRNYGTNNLTSTTINWSLNGVTQTPFAWTGNLAKDSTAMVVLGNSTFQSGNSYDLNCWTTAPNNLTDDNNMNDTIQQNYYTYLSGTYTVGHPNSDFPTFQSALNTLHASGINGAVTFQLQPKTYQGSFHLEAVYGTSATNTITIDGGHPDSVLIKNQIGSSFELAWVYRESPIYIIGTDHLTIKNLSVESTVLGGGSSVYVGYSVYVSNESDTITFDNNTMYCKDVQGNLVNQDLTGNILFPDIIDPYTGQTINNGTYRKIINNRFYGGDKGVEGGGANNAPFIFKNNTVSNTDFALSIVSSSNDSIFIMNNHFENNILSASSTYNYIGSNYFDGGGITINGNARASIVNNIIETDGKGIHLNYTNADVIHNTVRSKEQALSFYFSANNNLNIVNNIFITDTLSAIAYYGTPSQNSTIDYNIYYSPMSGSLIEEIINFSNSNFKSYNVWKSQMPTLNLHSLEATDLTFIDLTDLHILNGIALDAGVTTTITEDIDGDARPQLNAPDIGADEYQPIALDAALIALNAPSIPFIAGNQAVKITLQNIGTDTLTSATINWQIDNIVQVPFVWSGNLLSGQSDSALTIGNYNFIDVATIDIWLSTVNGQPNDENSLNDTINEQLCAALAGVYTIGGSNADFVDFDGALAVLNSCGVVDTVIFEIQPNTYHTNFTLSAFEGANANSPVIFDGLDAKNVIIVNDVDLNMDYTMLIDGGDFYTFKNITFKNTNRSLSSTSAVRIKNEADYLTFTNCVFEIPTNATSISGSFAFANSFTGLSVYNGFEGNADTARSNYLTVKDCLFDGGDSGLRIIRSNANFPLDKNTTIIGNTFMNYELLAMQINQQENLVVQNNKILPTYEIEERHGILLEIIKSGTITNNYIEIDRGIGLQVTNYYLNGSTYPGSVHISNNMIHVLNNIPILDPTYSSFFGGIEVNSLLHSEIFHNTIYTNYGAALRLALCDTAIVKNNIFHNNSKNSAALTISGAAQLYGISDFDINHNLYYSKIDLAAQIDNTNYSTLGQFQTAHPQWNANSLYGLANFKSPQDFKVLNGLGVDAGDNSVGILTDIEGEIRPQGNVVDMGADEYLGVNNDLGIATILSPTIIGCGEAQHPIVVLLRNNGLNTYPATNVRVELSGAINQTFTGLSNSLLSYDYDTLFLGMVNSLAGGDLAIKVILDNNSDADVGNDSLERHIYILPSAGVNPVIDSICTFPADVTFTPAAIASPSHGYVWLDSLGFYESVASRDASLSFTGLSADTALYVMAALDTASVGRKTYLGSPYEVNSSAGGLAFLVEQPIIIDSITVFPAQAGSSSINFITNIPDEYTISVPFTITSAQVGQAVQIPISLYFPPSTYRISNPANTINMYRNSSDAGFPYEVDNVIKITKNNNSLNINEYSLFYDWKITVLGCDVQQTQIEQPDSATIPFIIQDFTTVMDSAAIGLGSATPIVTGGTPTYFYQWDANANSQTTETATSLFSGMYELTITDVFGCVASDTVTIMSVNNHEVARIKEFKLFPNPAINHLYFELALEKSSDVMMEIYDVVGRKVSQKTYSNVLTLNEKIDITAIDTGIYLVKISTKNATITKKLFFVKD